MVFKGPSCGWSYSMTMPRAAICGWASMSAMVFTAAQGMPMMMVTHDMWFARNVASRVIFCAGGVVVEDGPPEQVLGNPREARTREFIERVFHIKA